MRRTVVLRTDWLMWAKVKSYKKEYISLSRTEIFAPMVSAIKRIQCTTIHVLSKTKQNKKKSDITTNDHAKKSIIIVTFWFHWF